MPAHLWAGASLLGEFLSSVGIEVGFDLADRATFETLAEDQGEEVDALDPVTVFRDALREGLAAGKFHLMNGDTGEGPPRELLPAADNGEGKKKEQLDMDNVRLQALVGWRMGEGYQDRPQARGDGVGYIRAGDGKVHLLKSAAWTAVKRYLSEQGQGVGCEPAQLWQGLCDRAVSDCQTGRTDNQRKILGAKRAVVTVPLAWVLGENDPEDDVIPEREKIPY